MSVSLPFGSVFSIAASYGPAIPFTALTNASPPVASSVAHGLTNGNVLEVTSGWGLINDRPARASAITTDTFALEGFNTTSTTKYGAGAGLGSVRKVLTWAQFSQTTGTSKSGGEQQFIQYVFLEDGIQRQKATFKTARSLQLIFADDPALPFYSVLRDADEDGLNRIIRLVLPGGSTIYYNGQVSFNDDPDLSDSDINKVSATFSFAAKFVRYAS